MIGYVVAGPILALLISLKFTQHQQSKHKVEYDALVTKVELLQTRSDEVDKELLQKIMTTVMPLAKAVNKLSQEVGL